MLKCIVIDDEQQCVDLLSAMLKTKFGGRLSIVATSTDAEDGIELIKAFAPQLLFLDVEMPGFSGLQLLEHFPEREFSVVFTTAHAAYALEALKTEAIDYLLKPISLSELEAAVEKCEKREALLRQEPAQPKRLLLHTGKGSLLVALAEIVRFEAHNNYCTVIFTNRPKLVVARTLKVFDDQLTDSGFFRLHQSHLINLSHVKSYLNGAVGFAVLSNGDKVEIARRRKSEFLKIISNTK